MQKSRPKKTTRRRRKKQNHILIGTLITLLLVLCGTGAFTVYQFQKMKQEQAKQEAQEKREKEEAKNTPVEPVIPEEPEETVPQKIDFPALWTVNTDAYAFIEIPGTQVNYPVMQSSTQEENYYLNVTFEKIAGLPGSIFTQMVNEKDFLDPITIIYGHDMLDGSYFGDLKNYVDRAFFDTYREIYIYLPDRQLRYEIVAEVVFDDTYIPEAFDIKISDSVVDFMDRIVPIPEPQNQFVEGAVIEEGDKLIVLSTCIGDRPDNRRLIVAKLMDDKKTE